MLSTVPSPELLFIYSPFKKGLKNSIKTPPARLDKLPCNANPTANPAVPNNVIKEVAFTPKPPITKKKNPIYIIVLVKERIKDDKSSST